MRFSALSALALLFLGAVAGQGTQMTLQEALMSQVSAQAVTPISPFPAPTTGSGTAIVTITGVSYSGSGCPHRTVLPSLTANGQVLTLQFYQYAIKLDQYTLYNSVKKSCRIYYTLRSPTGYVFTNTAFGLSATYALSDAQVEVTARAALWLASDPAMKSFATVQVFGPTPPGLTPGVPNPVPFPITSVGTSANPVQLENPWWSVCPPQNMNPAAFGNVFERTAVVLDTSVTLQRMAQTSYGYMTVDGISGTFQKASLLSWEDCTAVWEAEDGDMNF